MDLSTVNLQAEFRKFLFGYLEVFVVVVAPAEFRKSKLQAEFRKFFSFKHHLTGEAWPACRAILPFHSNTT